MTEPRTYSSPAGRADRRTEFVAFYEATYSAITGEVLALTGDLDLAQIVARASYARTWQAWPAVRNLDWPVMWVRADAVRRTRRPPRGDRLLQHGLPALEEVALDPEDEVLVAGLQCLSAEHRLPLVLHHLGHLPVETITEWFGDPTDELEVRLEAGFDALVAILDWPDDADEDSEDADDSPAYVEAGQADAYEWTAEALESCAQRFRDTFPIPPPALVFRRATVKKVTRRGAPITAAAAAAVIGLVVYLSPAPQHTAQAAGYAAPPRAAAAAPAELDTVTAETTEPETATAETTSPAGTTTKSAGRRATTKNKASEGNAVAAVPALALSTLPVVTTSATPTSTTPTSTTPTSSTSTSTTPTTTAAAIGGETGTTGGETGGGTGTGDLAGSESIGTGSTGSSVVTTTGSTTPDTTTGTDETTTEETTSATTTRQRDDDEDDCPPTTTETTATTTDEITTTETTTTDPGTTETLTTETQPTLLSLVDETNTTTATVARATGRSASSATGQASE